MGPEEGWVGGGDPGERFRAIVSQCAVPTFTFEVVQEIGPRYFLRVLDPDGICNETGRPMPWKGRMWRLSPHMTDGEVVGTAFLALLTALEHEARERFTFQGTAVYDSHVDIYKLVALRKEPGCLAERVHAPTPPPLKAHLFDQYGRAGDPFCVNCGMPLSASDGVSPCSGPKPECCCHDANGLDPRCPVH